MAERRLRRQPIALTIEQSARLVREAWRAYQRAPAHLGTVSFQNACIVELWLSTASRYSQILRLRWDQVQGRSIVFPEQKRGSPRRVSIVGRVAKVLAAQPRSGPYVFPGIGKRGHRDNLRRFWQRITKAAALPGLRPHDLRHTATTIAHEDGETTAQLMDRLGHRSREMVDRVYTHPRGRSMRPVKVPLDLAVAAMLPLAARREAQRLRDAQTH